MYIQYNWFQMQGRHDEEIRKTTCSQFFQTFSPRPWDWAVEKQSKWVVGDGDKVGDREVWSRREGKETGPWCKRQHRNWVKNFDSFQIFIISSWKCWMSGKYRDCGWRQLEWVCMPSESNHHSFQRFASALFLSRSAWERSSQQPPSTHIVFVSGPSQENIRWVRFRIQNTLLIRRTQHIFINFDSAIKQAFIVFPAQSENVFKLWAADWH